MKTDGEILSHAAMEIVPFKWELAAESVYKEERKEPGLGSFSFIEGADDLEY